MTVVDGRHLVIRMRLPGVLLCAVLVVTGCTGSGDDDPSPTPTPSPTLGGVDPAPSDAELDAVDWSQTSSAQLDALADEDGSSTVEQAVAAFQLAFGPLPDAPQPLPVDLSAPLSGTHALELIARHVDELTPAQLAYFTSRPGLDVTVRRERTEPEAAGVPGTPSLVPATQRLAAPAEKTPSVEPTDVPTMEDPSATDRERARWEAMAATAWADLGRRTGQADGLNERGRPWTISLATPDSSRSSGAWTRPTVDEEGFPTCDIWIWNLRASANQDSRAMGLYHELVHCAMWVLALSTDQYESLPQWMIEGYTSWAGEVGGGPSSWSRRWWAQYRCPACRHGTWSMFRADYDAIGFWSFLADRGADLWGAFFDLSRVRGGQPLWDLAEGLLPDRDDLAELASAATDRDFNEAWEMDGPTILPAGRDVLEAGRLRVGGTAHVRVSSLKQAAIALERPVEDGPILVEAHLVGSGTATWDTGSQVQVARSVDDVAWCLGCTCPDGTVLAPDVPQVDDGATELVVAVHAAWGTSSWAEIEVRRPDESCPEPDPDTPPPGPPPPPTGRSVADPHLVTFDGRGYDFHAVGEFVLVRDDDVEVQVRQVPLSGGLGVTANGAVVVATDDAVVQVESDRLLLDGEVVDAVARDLDQGGRVEATAGALTWDLPDGSRIDVTGGLGVTMVLADGRTVSGLLGDGNGNRDDDFRLASGEIIDVSMTAVPVREVMYGDFADSWRVDESTSRFAYGPGEGTEDFTDRAFPGRPFLLEALSRGAFDQAEQACDDAGVSDPLLRGGCLVDVGATDDRSWADEAGIVEELLAELAVAFQQSRVDEPGPSGSSAADEALLAAAATCDDEQVAAALAAGASPDASDGQDTALHVAVQVREADCTAVVRALVDAGADVVRLQEGLGQAATPLHLVVDPASPASSWTRVPVRTWRPRPGTSRSTSILLRNNQMLTGVTAAPIVTTLLEAGADPNGGSNRSLLVQAVNGADVAVVRALLAAGADPDPRLADGSTPLHEAGFATTYDQRDAELVEALIDGGADPDAQDVRGQTPLHNGVLSANVLGIEALLERGADPCLRNDAGQTPGGLAFSDDIAALFPACPS